MNEEINGKLDVITEGIKGAQKMVDEANARSDVRDAELDEKLEKASNDIVKAMEDVQKLNSQQETITKVNESLEKMICKMPNAAGDSKDENLKVKGEFISYLRKGRIPSDESVIELCTSVVDKSYPCLGEAEKAVYLKAMVEGINPDGGYEVRPEVSTTVITRIFETSNIRQIANIETTAAESMEFLIDDDESAAVWAGEVDSRSETGTPQIGLKEIHTKEIIANPKISQRLLDDAGFDIETWLAKKVSDKFSRTENTAFVSGNNPKQPRGFLTYPAWASAGVYEREKIEQVNSGTAADFTGDGVIELQNSLKDAYQLNAIWGLNRRAFANILKLKDSEDRYLLLRDGDLHSNPQKALLGQPIIFMNDMPTVAANALALVYGDFKVGYTIVDRIGIRVLRDPYTAKPFVLFYTTKRVGGDVTSYESLKIQKLAV